MDDERIALIRNGAYTLVPRTLGMNVIDNRWAYKIKRNTNGSFQRYKAQLVAKGFTQRSSSLVILALICVDNMIVTRNNIEKLKQFITKLNLILSLKDLGSLYYFLGIEVH
uniref:Reverse transcriptase Ty1/copia-type domain-containing protein n=1 Tax=Cannabis sativa TaxID=3483 RepID=A0A803QDS0_CANSA